MKYTLHRLCLTDFDIDYRSRDRNSHTRNRARVICFTIFTRRFPLDAAARCITYVSSTWRGETHGETVHSSRWRAPRLDTPSRDFDQWKRKLPTKPATAEYRVKALSCFSMLLFINIHIHATSTGGSNARVRARCICERERESLKLLVYPLIRCYATSRFILWPLNGILNSREPPEIAFPTVSSKDHHWLRLRHPY